MSPSGSMMSPSILQLLPRILPTLPSGVRSTRRLDATSFTTASPNP